LWLESKVEILKIERTIGELQYMEVRQRSTEVAEWVVQIQEAKSAIAAAETFLKARNALEPLIRRFPYISHTTTYENDDHAVATTIFEESDENDSDEAPEVVGARIAPVTIDDDETDGDVAMTAAANASDSATAAPSTAAPAAGPPDAEMQPQAAGEAVAMAIGEQGAVQAETRPAVLAAPPSPRSRLALQRCRST